MKFDLELKNIHMRVHVCMHSASGLVHEIQVMDSQTKDGNFQSILNILKSNF